MATVADRISFKEPGPDALSGTPRAHALDRWIFVAMAAWFIAIVLVGFIPDAIMKVDMVRAGTRPPFPPVLHVHAVVMGAFLLTLLAQTWMMATGRRALHMQIGIFGMALAVALVIVGFVLAPTMYYQTWNGLQIAPAAAREQLQQLLSVKENILLLQLGAGLLFAVFIAIAVSARKDNPGLHKRMMILGTAVPLAASIDRMEWLPSSFPASPWTTDLYILAAVSPMFVWDVVRNKRVHEAYWIWLSIYVPVVLIIDLLWNTPWWHATARAIMRV
jgi:hypothetical protein